MAFKARRLVDIVYGPLLSVVQGRGDLGLLAGGHGKLSVVLPRRAVLKVHRDSCCGLSWVVGLLTKQWKFVSPLWWWWWCR